VTWLDRSIAWLFAALIVAILAHSALVIRAYFEDRVTWELFRTEHNCVPTFITKDEMGWSCENGALIVRDR
jgi:hypothetical protein